MVNRRNLGYGTPSGLSKLYPNPIEANRPPTGTDRGFIIGQLWIDREGQDSYILVDYSDGLAIWAEASNSGGTLNTLSGDVGVATPVTGNINIVGAGGVTTTGSPGQLIVDGSALGTTFPITPYVVGPVGEADYQTIQSAITAANAAGGGSIWIQPGTYTENLTLFANISLIGNSGVAGPVVISGTHTPPVTGNLSFSAIQFNSVTDIISVPGPNAAFFFFDGCQIRISGGGFILNLPSGIGAALFVRCVDVSSVAGGTSSVLNNGAGSLTFQCLASNLGTSLGTLAAGGSLQLYNSNFECGITTSGGLHFIDDCVFTATTSLDSSATLTSSVFTTLFLTGGTTLIDSCIAGDITTSNNCNVSIQYSQTGQLTQSSTGTMELYRVNIDTAFNPALAGAGTGVVSLGDVLFVNNSAVAGTLTTTNVGVTRNNSVSTNNLNVYVGSNATMGTSGAMVGGTIVVTTNKVLATSRIFLSINTLGTVLVPNALWVSSINSGVDFTISSADITDTSTVNWFIVNEA